MAAPDIFKVTPAYSDPAKNAAEKALIQGDAWASYDMAMQHNYKAAQDILLDWALHCREVKGSEGGLVMTFKGFSFLQAYWLMQYMDWNKGIFPPWVHQVYRPCAYNEQYDEENNRASWGILGCVMADMILGVDLAQWYGRVNKNMAAAIGKGGVMKIEVLRTNSGMFYSYFALAAMLKTCQLLKHPNIDKLLSPLWWLWQYVKHPETWPYKPGQGIWRWFPNLQRKIHPYSDVIDLPRSNDWSGSLYLAAGREFGVDEWIQNATPWDMGAAPFPGVNVYRWIT